MPTSSGPFTPAPGVPIVVDNPAAGAGNLFSAAAVVVNVSPYELAVATGAGSVTGLIDPFTRDLVALDPNAGQQLTINPLNIGFTPPAGVSPTIYVLWYLPNESMPRALPAPIVPYGNLQTVSVAGTANVDIVGGLANPLPVAITGQPIQVVPATLSPPTAFGYGGAASLGGTAGSDYTYIPAPATGSIWVCGWNVWCNQGGAATVLLSSLPGGPAGGLIDLLTPGGQAPYAFAARDFTRPIRVGTGLALYLHTVAGASLTLLEGSVLYASGS